ncbi:MAG: hypothetical protein WCO06_06295 [Candidatus Roizmanbacteria bacterium]
MIEQPYYYDSYISKVQDILKHYSSLAYKNGVIGQRAISTSTALLQYASDSLKRIGTSAMKTALATGQDVVAMLHNGQEINLLEIEGWGLYAVSMLALTPPSFVARKGFKYSGPQDTQDQLRTSQEQLLERLALIARGILYEDIGNAFPDRPEKIQVPVVLKSGTLQFAPVGLYRSNGPFNITEQLVASPLDRTKSDPPVRVALYRAGKRSSLNATPFTYMCVATPLIPYSQS